MSLTQLSGMPAIMKKNYSLLLPEDRPFALLRDPRGNRLADLFIPSSIHTLEGLDDTVALHPWQIEEQSDMTLLSMEAHSSHWQRKTYRLRCLPDRLTCEIEVTGSGRLTRACYFGGYSSAQLRWGSGFFVSGQAFRQGWTPEPNAREAQEFPPSAGMTIDLTGVPLPGRDDWFFTPPPFCLAFQLPYGWLGLGVEAAPGAYRFTEYTYHGRPEAFYLSLNYEGHTAVEGTYRLPTLSFDFGSNPFEVLAAHLHAVAQPFRPPPARPSWWSAPIFCGWGAQCARAAQENGRAPDYARQSEYENFLHALDSQGITPGTIVIDDKWQQTYGSNQVDPEKWPDLRGFIREQHARDRKVLLWLKAWDPEGLPAAECIVNAADRPIAADPTYPDFIIRQLQTIATLLSPAGYDADGFKIDFTARIPAGPGIQSCGDLWGLELMRAWLELIYKAAKSVKSQALIMTHTPHPYLSDLIDMVRLNDMNPDRALEPAMLTRARVAALACPNALIDTDNWPIGSRAGWRRYLALQPRLGIPSLYYAGALDSGETLTADDLSALQGAWTAYRELRPAAAAPFAVRGVIEAFYGVFYTHAERDELLRFLAHAGYNAYLYGPKNDRYHRDDWRTPYPEKMLDRFAETIALAQTLGIDFGYALSPVGIAYASDADWTLVKAKLYDFYSRGVRNFSLFLDDIEPHFQHSVDAKCYPDFAAAHADLGNCLYAWLQELDPTCRLSLCPTDYHGRPPFSAYLKTLGAELHPEILLFYTGPQICSTTLTVEDARAFAAVTRRAPLIWDNYPVNDLTMQSELHLGPIRGRDAALGSAVQGLYVNPMSQIEASRIALLTYADYLADPRGYDPQSAWEKALHQIAGTLSYPALRLFADHTRYSCLEETAGAPLCTLVQNILAQKPGALAELAAYLQALDTANYHLLAEMENQALRAELLPWMEALSGWLNIGRQTIAILQHPKSVSEMEIASLQEKIRQVQAHPKRIAGHELAELVSLLQSGTARLTTEDREQHE